MREEREAPPPSVSVPVCFLRLRHRFDSDVGGQTDMTEKSGEDYLTSAASSGKFCVTSDREILR